METVYLVTAEGLKQEPKEKRLVGVVFDPQFAERVKSMSDENVKFDYKRETVYGRLYHVSRNNATSC